MLSRKYNLHDKPINVYIPHFDNWRIVDYYFVEGLLQLSEVDLVGAQVLEDAEARVHSKRVKESGGWKVVKKI